MKWSDWENYIKAKTERLLTWRRRRKLRKKARQKRKNQILDWVQALLWAAFVVLLVNQYLLQAYAIPTGSMEDTILGEDRIFVDKAVYGPELVPGAGKLPGSSPQRGEIIVFVNPNYHSEMQRDISGAEELVNRLLYMLTFTIVNLDRRPDGQIAHHFLVKRLIGLPGEQLRMRNGKVELKRVCEDRWTPEDYPFDAMRYWLSVVENVLANKLVPQESFKNEFVQLSYNELKKFYPFEKYDLIKRYIVNQNLKLLKLPADEKLGDMETEYRKLAVTPRTDEYFEDYWRARTRAGVKPYDRSTRILWERRVLGWYIPTDKFFPMGDNRDNSRDARYFGPVKLDQLLGRALFRFWPPHRFGGI